MGLLAHQKNDPLAIAAIGVAVVVAALVAVVVPQLMPWSFVILFAMALIVAWAVRGEITAVAWMWVLSYGLLDWPQWKMEIPGFFTMSVPRWIFLGAVLAFAIHFLIYRRTLRGRGALLWMMVAMIAYFAVSATLAGWTIPMPKPAGSAPYFRFLEPLLFPLVMFVLVFNTVSREKQIAIALIVVGLYGWYALYIGYLQYAAVMGAEGARSLIWPGYINEATWEQTPWGPAWGIHGDRARGAFAQANPQANLLILIFFGNLLLIRRLRGPYRVVLVLQTILIPPAIFFTGLRSAYLSFLVCGAIWCLVADRHRFGKAKLALGVVALAIAVFAMWSHLTTTNRATGGVAQIDPLRTRWVLVERAWQMLKAHPATGVGFGHFMEASQNLPQEPGTIGSQTGLVRPDATPANLLLVLAAETGLLGVAGIVTVFLLLIGQSLQLYRKLPPTAQGILCREFVVVFWVLMAAYLIDGSFVDSLWDVPTNALFWSFAGLMVGYNRLLEPHRLDLPVTPSLIV